MNPLDGYRPRRSISGRLISALLAVILFIVVLSLAIDFVETAWPWLVGFAIVGLLVAWIWARIFRRW